MRLVVGAAPKHKPVGIVFKGSGFYATDNRSASGRLNGSKPEKSETGTSSAETTEKTSATESKTAESK